MERKKRVVECTDKIELGVASAKEGVGGENGAGRGLR